MTTGYVYTVRSAFLPFRRLQGRYRLLALAACLALLGLPLAATAQAPHDLWKTEYVDVSSSFADMTDRSLTLDADGQPHVAYGQDHLYYAWRDGSGWHRDVVDTAYPVGGSASLALDSGGYAHISYVVRTDWGTAVRYAWQSATGWNLYYLHSSGEYCQLALDASGYPHIVHATDSSGYLQHTYRDITGWHSEIAPPDIYISGSFSLALDAAGYPHVSFRGGYDYTLNHAYKDAGGWHMEQVTSPGSSYTDSSIVVGADGYARIAYHNAYADGLEYAYQDATGWYTDTVDSIGGTFPSLALDGEGRPHITYYGSWQLRYAYHDGSTWHTEQVDSVALGYYTSLALDAAGRPHLSFSSESPARMIYAYKDETGWHTEPFDRGDNEIGPNPSLALDTAGQAHISYHDEVNNQLKYARQSGGGWQTEEVDSGGSGGWYSCLKLESVGQPCVAYGGEGVEYACRDEAGWHPETVDAGAIPHAVSLALDSGGQPHVAYMDWNGQELKYAYRDGSGWHVAVVPSGSSGYVSYYVSLVLDGDGYPHIVFHETSNYQLKYAYQDSEGWHVETVDAPAGAGSSDSLTLDAAGQPHVSYYSSYDLRYAVRDGSGWHIEEPTYGGGGSSLALDSAGYAHISHNDSGERLMYTYQDAEGWHTTVLKPRQGAARGSSLELDGDGRPRIAYYAYSEKDLVYTYALPGHGVWLPYVTRAEESHARGKR